MTTPRLSTRRELELMQQLQQVADKRAGEERILAAAISAELETAEKEFEQTARKLNEAYSAKSRVLEEEYATVSQAAIVAHDEAIRQAETRHKTALKGNDDRRNASLAAAEHHAQELEWQANTVFEAHKGQPQQLVEETTKRLQSRRRIAEGLQRDANTLLELREQTQAAAAFDWRADPATELLTAEIPAAATADDRLQQTLNLLKQAVLDLQDQKLPSLFLEGKRWLGWLGGAAAFGALFGVVVGAISGLGWIIGLIAGLVLGSIGGGALVAVAVPRGRRRSLQQFGRIQRLLEQYQQLEQTTLVEAKAHSERLTQENIRRRERDVAHAHDELAAKRAELQTAHAAELSRVEVEAAAAIAEISAKRDAALSAAEAKYPPLIEQAVAGRSREERENAERFDARRAAAHEKQATAWQQMADAWQSGFRAVSDELAAMQNRCRELFPDWSTTDLAAWQRPTEPPEAIPFGLCPLPLQAVKHGVPDDPRLDPGVRRLVLPATMPLKEQPRMVITADGAGRRAAAEVLQLMMLRFLTSMPAGKLRFTIIDPAGLGENFAAFMHLADYDEQLVAARILTDYKQIDERLGIISQHMEKVLQKYLRNEFATIHEYNESAGEVAEPYHVIVAANFPHGFSDSAARKLVSISQSGPRCGVFTLLSIDTDVKLPHEFRLQPLLDDAVHLQWLDNRLVWKYPLFEKLPLELDRMPQAEELNHLLRIAGEQSRKASRVEVPFSMVAPPPDRLWEEDSSRELVVPMGRAGAKELQSLRFGVGTSQHALISGKTGSGKSTLLHALITNVALHYAPDQVELYLVDFKKGVEFKAYANGRLPHARVIAIESEREFGVSVLERLDAELRRRGELFRSYAVQDLGGFRRAAPEIPMPRTMLIVDEFQELFVADDKLAQDAALLLDRLVRQGRAFGIHVMLGSQTLAGAYSLARSTLGQMAVRIALECSEADAHLILSDENTAARLLNRPGEAIYNDQNGLVAGNHPFQVVWLPDPQRQAYLAALLAQPTPRMPTDEPTIVFEGNIPANPFDNPDMVAAISHPERTTHLEPTLWLGSAVRIEPSTHLVLRRQGGHNLIVIGQDEEMAAGVLANIVIALAAQHGEAGARFTILDGTRPESHVPGMWNNVAAAVGDAVEVVPPRGAAAAIHALADEVKRRGESPEERYPSLYLIIYDLAQIRDLRQTEDDFSFSFSKDKNAPPAPDRRFREILKEGPVVGVHVLLWCESYNSLTRAVDRLSLREVEFRVAMQMSGADSTSLIDSPAATLLGANRALLYRDDIGTQTKFRPYGPPTEEWLAWVAEKTKPRSALAE
ncbi:FtsK/SpoIIIE domain-containing protein [Lacipirellula parvula]|nr:FtsK/SpoIIIE domain-containing protein [Lacipirellula parvula]